jgi:hypothetical protein
MDFVIIIIIIIIIIIMDEYSAKRLYNSVTCKNDLILIQTFDNTKHQIE